MEVVDVKPYDGEVLTRAVSSTGLWTVEVEVNKDYDETDFDKATTVVKMISKMKQVILETRYQLHPKSLYCLL